jgi:hypothetical protein
MQVATSWQPHFRRRCAREDTQTTSTSFSGPLGEGTDGASMFICTFSLFYGEVYTFVVFNSYKE